MPVKGGGRQLNRAQQAIADTGLSLEYIAGRAWVGVPHLKRILRRGTPAYATALRIAEATGINIIFLKERNPPIKKKQRPLGGTKPEEKMAGPAATGPASLDRSTNEWIDTILRFGAAARNGAGYLHRGKLYPPFSQWPAHKQQELVNAMLGDKLGETAPPPPVGNRTRRLGRVDMHAVMSKIARRRRDRLIDAALIAFIFAGAAYGLGVEAALAGAGIVAAALAAKVVGGDIKAEFDIALARRRGAKEVSDVE